MVFSATYQERVISAALYAANLDQPNVPAQREGTLQAAKARREAGIETMPRPTDFNDHKNPTAAQRTAQALRKFDLKTIVEKLTMPILIGTGRHDPNPASSRVIAKTTPCAELLIFKNVGHNAILEHPDLALETFLKFHTKLAN